MVWSYLDAKGIGILGVCFSADQRVERYGSSWDVVLRDCGCVLCRTCGYKRLVTRAWCVSDP